ncbi:hypothetical protein F5X98DRAFT_85815 [Xylaria grammica]|nr:hypothetical protein F5X98DRAFT_85815 [Xylaria grammica]
MFGEKWGWKKYNQDKPKPPSGRKRERSSRDDSSDTNEEESVVSTIESEASSRDVGSLRTLLPTLFDDQGSDEESLSTLKGGNPRNVSECIGLCFRWCEREIGGCEAPFLFPYDEDGPESKYDLDARVFIYFLDRYIESAKSPAKHNDWDNVAECSVKFSPIKMLLTMSTLIVVVVSNAKRVSLEDPSLNVTRIFDLAKIGIDEINQNRWGDKKLAAEFCNDFESILGDYADYGKAINSAIYSYERQKWSQDQAVGVLEFADGEVYQDESWPENMQGGGETIWTDLYN